MLKRTNRLCAYVLLAVLPLQGIAAANLLVCNSVMQVTTTAAIASTATQNVMPCHEPLSNMVNQHTSDNNHSSVPMCKSTCNAICASMNAFASPQMQATQAPRAILQIATQFVQSFYASITLASLQRPPITLS